MRNECVEYLNRRDNIVIFIFKIHILPEQPLLASSLMSHGRWGRVCRGLTLAKLESWQQKHYFSLGLHFYRHLWRAAAASCRRGSREGRPRREDREGKEFKRDFCSLVMSPSWFIGCPFYWAGVCFMRDHYNILWGCVHEGPTSPRTSPKP